MKKILLLAVALTLGTTSYVSAEQDGYDALMTDSSRAFAYSAALSGQITFRSPLRNANLTDKFAPVNSKYDQPRSTTSGSGSNPHVGVDLHAIDGTDVYPIAKGKVYYSDKPGSGGDGTYGRVTIQIDVNNDGQYDPPPFLNDNLFVTYMHMRNITAAKNDIVDVNDSVGGVSNVGTTAVHLHWEINTVTTGCQSYLRDSGCLSVRLSPYYEGLAANQWNGGKDLDFVSDISWVNGRRAQGYVYTMTPGGVKVSVNQGDVKLFHRQAGTSTWTRTAMVKNGDLFYLDLNQFYPTGTQIELYGRATRSDIARPTTECGTTPYNYSFMKPRIYRPNPCTVDNDDVFTVTLSY